MLHLILLIRFSSIRQILVEVWITFHRADTSFLRINYAKFL